MRKRFAIGLVAAMVALILVVARRHALLHFAVQEGAGLAGGYAVRIGTMHVASDGLELLNVSAARGGEPVLAARRILVHYSLRDLFPGSRHRFGLVGVDVAGVKLTLTRLRDGSFNLNLPAARRRRYRNESIAFPFVSGFA